MLILPKSTEFNKCIPKEKFYENRRVSPDLKRAFVEQIKGIWWFNKIAKSTTNLAVGEAVTEIEVFVISLARRELDEAVLRQIDKEIPYHILFLLEYAGKYQARIAYKERTSSGKSAFKVGRYFSTGWMEATALPLKMEGVTTDQVYENWVRQIAEEGFSRTGESLKQSVLRDERCQELKKRIVVQERKVRREKQLNKQLPLNAELKRLRKELEELSPSRH